MIRLRHLTFKDQSVSVRQKPEHLDHTVAAWLWSYYLYLWWQVAAVAARPASLHWVDPYSACLCTSGRSPTSSFSSWGAITLPSASCTPGGGAAACLRWHSSLLPSSALRTHCSSILPPPVHAATQQQNTMRLQINKRKKKKKQMVFSKFKIIIYFFKLCRFFQLKLHFYRI